MMRSKVVVIGAGVMGSATAQWLAANGTTVVLIDQYERGHARGGSHGDSRIFRLAYPESDYVQLAQRSLTLWREIETNCGRELLIRTGGVDHGRGAVASIGSALGRCGVGFEVVPAPTAMGRWPGMRFEGEVVLQADAGRLHADEAVDAFQALAESDGATLLFGCRAAIARVDDWRVVITTERGDFEADAVVLAAGPWAPLVTPGDLELPPLRVTHEQPAYFPVRQAGIAWPVFVHYDANPYSSFAGYGLEVPGRGVKVGLHASGLVIDPGSVDRPSSREVRERLGEYVSSWLPGLAARPTETVSCVYDSTPDEDFVIDRRGRIVVATGFSGHGFKFAPAIGRLVGQIATGEALAPPRFRFRTG
jgi:sarcosine oxidase